MLKRHLHRVIYHQVYWYTKITGVLVAHRILIAPYLVPPPSLSLSLALSQEKIVTISGDRDKVCWWHMGG